jgi:acylphosphatase
MNEPAHIIVHIVVHVVIFGRVQGVGYRAFVAREAGRHCLEGWVRNCRDGTVEALFKGEAEVIDDMIATCRRGPSGARVDAVNQSPGTDADLRARVPGEEFSVLPTF